jgi:hypothetical protein
MIYFVCIIAFRLWINSTKELYRFFRVIFSQNASQPGSFNFNQDYKRLKKCYGMDPNDVELNGEKVFRNMSDMQKRRIGKAFNGSARCNKDIVSTAHAVAESMGYTNADELMSVIEIVTAEVKGDHSLISL